METPNVSAKRSNFRERTMVRPATVPATKTNAIDINVNVNHAAENTGGGPSRGPPRLAAAVSSIHTCIVELTKLYAIDWGTFRVEFLLKGNALRRSTVCASRQARQHLSSSARSEISTCDLGL